MGYNTTIMFHNDAYDQFEKHPDETMENILRAMDNVPHERHHYGVGNHSNPMKVMKPRHSNETMIYVLSGNTLVEMSNYSSETDKLLHEHPDFFKDMLDRMDVDVKILKERYKKLMKDKKDEA